MIANSLDVNMPWILNARHLLLWQNILIKENYFLWTLCDQKSRWHLIFKSLSLSLLARCLVRYSLTTILEQVVVDKRPAAAPSLMGGMILMEWIFYQRITSQTIASHFLIKFVDDWPPNSNPWNTLVACPLAPHCDKRDLLLSHETQPLHFHTNQRWYRWSVTPWHETIIVEFLSKQAFDVCIAN